ncbi:MAG TPA: bifunctional oligoribonuclease/PAP phosphatase NrnA [Chthoniobacterales bacterium]
MNAENASFAQIGAAIAAAKTLLVTSHLRPDGDALGSTLACALWLRQLGKDVTAWNEDGVLEKFHYLPEWPLVTRPEGNPREFDAVILLDTSVKNRAGTCLDHIAKAGVWINLDHHISNGRFGDLNYVDPTAPATGEILHQFLQSQNAAITPGIAANLFAAISTDTGSFQYAGTSPRTFRIAAELVEAGVDVAQLSRRMYDSQPRRRLDLLRHALNAAEFACNDHAVSFTLTLADAERLGVVPEDNEGIIDQLRAVDTVVAAVFFEELPENRVRVSARSKDPRVDVCRICGLFGGGGHPLAAGARIRGSIKEVKSKLMEAVCHEIRNRH